MGEDWGYLRESLSSSSLDVREMKRISREKIFKKKLSFIGKLLNQYSIAREIPVTEGYELMFFPLLSKIMSKTGSMSYSEKLKSLEHMIDVIVSQTGGTMTSKAQQLRHLSFQLSRSEKNDITR